MAGKGPAPKGNAVRRNASVVPLRVIQVQAAEQPELPDFNVKINVKGEIYEKQFDWPDQTRDWWRMWKESPLMADATQDDWSFLLDTALLHAAYWNGDLSVGGELRLRVAKYGPTPEDKARLRIATVRADKAEAEAPPKRGSTSRKRRGPLTG